MELTSPIFFSEARRERLRFASDKLAIQIVKLNRWAVDRGRQWRSITGNESLVKALLSAEKSPVEGARLNNGEQIRIYDPLGGVRRFRICGVRSGGFSNAYSVIDLDEMKPYCLKENRALPGDERRKNEKLAFESDIALRLGRHPHIVAAEAAFHHRGRLYLLTEYLPDQSLDIKLKQGPLPLREAIRYAIQICQAIVHARTLLPGFVHGDIKPGNCMLTPEGAVKLGDLGLASADGLGRCQLESGTNESRSGSLESARGWGGTTPYMAPEMFDTVAPDRRHADVYAFGITLFEMIAGRRPFSHPSKPGLIEMHRSSAPPIELLRSGSLPGALVDLIECCLSKSPGERPQDFRFIQATLQTCLGNPGRITAIDNVDPIQRVEPETLAISFAEVGNTAASITVLDNEIIRSGRNAGVLAVKSAVLLKAGKIGEAYEASTAALRIGTDLLSVMVAHANVLYARGNHDRALEYLERALQPDPANYTVLNMLGNVFSGLGDYNEAARRYRLSLMVDSEQPDAYEGLARVDMNRGRYDSAISYARKATEIDQSRAEAHVILARSLSKAGKNIEGVKAYKAALACNPESRCIRREFVSACSAVWKEAGREVSLNFLRSVCEGAASLQRIASGGAPKNRFVERLANQLEREPEVIFFHDVTLVRLADSSATFDRQHLLNALGNARSRAVPPDGMAYHLDYSFGRVFYHLDEFKVCQKVFMDMLDRFGPNESSYYYLGACAELRAEVDTALDHYRKANVLLDCEDSRTGIRRMTHEIEKRRASQAIH